MAPVLKTGVPERVSGVRIPPLPPILPGAMRQSGVRIPPLPPIFPGASRQSGVRIPPLPLICCHSRGNRGVAVASALCCHSPRESAVAVAPAFVVVSRTESAVAVASALCCRSRRESAVAVAPAFVVIPEGNLRLLLQLPLLSFPNGICFRSSQSIAKRLIVKGHTAAKAQQIPAGTTTRR